MSAVPGGVRWGGCSGFVGGAGLVGAAGGAGGTSGASMVQPVPVVVVFRVWVVPVVGGGVPAAQVVLAIPVPRVGVGIDGGAGAMRWHRWC